MRKPRGPAAGASGDEADPLAEGAPPPKKRGRRANGEAGTVMTMEPTTTKKTSASRPPCPHGLAPRGRCLKCSGCPHGRQRSKCVECGGSEVCSHGRVRYRCKDCGGKGMCEHRRQRALCKECGGRGICGHGRQRNKCVECGGSSICGHGRQRQHCRECGGSSVCEHGRQSNKCAACKVRTARL